MILALVRLIQGFIVYCDTIGPVKYFADIPVPINKAKDYVYITSVSPVASLQPVLWLELIECGSSYS